MKVQYPATRRRYALTGALPKYPMHELETIGDYFDVPSCDCTPKNIYNACNHHVRLTGKRLHCFTRVDGSKRVILVGFEEEVA